MSVIQLEAEAREDMGKGASRRLRRIEGKVPAIVYGGSKEPISITLKHNKLVKALENEAIYSSVIDLALGKKKEHVIIKSMQRHPYRPIIMHVDFQRVTGSDVIVKQIPIHYTNEEQCKGVKAGGVLFHTMTQLEIRCKVKDLPEFIEIDVANLEKDHVLHLSDIKLPKGVELAVEIGEDGSHNLPVVSVHQPHMAEVETEAPETAADEVPAKEMKGEQAKSDEGEKEEKGEE
ncbi:50S ribosomal protein L25/general stress protein Ctc [Legionella sp. W05-934-2]|uniref:50S ribosomal protein L25/general stress protein Ctc n=1 Tax=Legionella sp. W05-934-2 TaxID=1198649 RepID=UPI003462A2EC